MCTTLRNSVVAVLSLLLGYFLQQQRTMEEKLSSMINLLEQASDGYDYNSPTQFNPEVSRKQVKDDLCKIAYFAAALDKLQLHHCETITRTALSYALYVHILFDKKGQGGVKS